MTWEDLIGESKIILIEDELRAEVKIAHRRKVHLEVTGRPGLPESNKPRIKKPGIGYSNSGNSHIMAYKRLRDRGVFTANKLLEVYELAKIIEYGNLLPGEYRWAYYRHATLLKRLHNPTARQKIIGIRKGGITREEKSAIECLKRLDTITDKSI